MISDREKACWAVAYAMQARTKQLSPALHKASSRVELSKPGLPRPDRDALVAALRDARSIASALEEGLRLLGPEPAA